jgi:hypothetical protein
MIVLPLETECGWGKDNGERKRSQIIYGILSSERRRHSGFFSRNFKILSISWLRTVPYLN